MSDLSGSEIIRVVDALIGETEAYGSTHIDHDRLVNQKKMEELTEHLIGRLYENTKYVKRVEYSMKEIGKDASDFLGYLVDEYELKAEEDIPIIWLEDFRDGLDMLSENRLMDAIDLIIEAYRSERKKE